MDDCGMAENALKKNNTTLWFLRLLTDLTFFDSFFSPMGGRAVTIVTEYTLYRPQAPLNINNSAVL